VLYRVKRSSSGEIYFPISVGILSLFMVQHPLVYLVPIAILTLADPAAAMIGVRFGRQHYPTIKGQKSVEGSLAFCLIALLCSLGLLSLSGLNLTVLLLAILITLVTMLAEALAWHGLDNLLIPLLAGGTLLAFYSLALLMLIGAICIALFISCCWFSVRVHVLKEVKDDYDVSSAISK
jgi:phytol kinase